MKFVLFYHSLASDWNHGNAHFLRGIVSELMARGHSVEVYEPAQGWSRSHQSREAGGHAGTSFESVYPGLRSHAYERESFDPAEAVDGADLVIVHEWTDPWLVEAIAALRRDGGAFRALFHDTHHRAITDTAAMAALPLEDYDGVLAFGRALSEVYRQTGWAKRVWTWHEAADARRFYPQRAADGALDGDLVWIGNWGDGERGAELEEFLIEPVRALGLKANVYGVRYPEEAQRSLAAAGISYRGWIPNYKVPSVFGRHRITVHIPRRPYTEMLPGIPTIRIFEALACGIPLISAPWTDSEGLFLPGRDFLMVRTAKQMKLCLQMLLKEPLRAAALADSGRETVLARHTCRHRVDELMAILATIQEQSTAREGAAV